MVVMQPQIVTSRYFVRLVTVTYKSVQELQASEILSKAIIHPFNKTLLVFADFFTVFITHTPDKRSPDIAYRSTFSLFAKF